MAFNKETGNLKLSGCLYQNFDKLVLVCHECTTDKGEKKIEVMDEKFSVTFPCHAFLFDFTCLHDAWTS